VPGNRDRAGAPYVLRRLITEVGSKAIRINWDPASMILWPTLFAAKLGESYNREKWIDNDPL